MKSKIDIVFNNILNVGSEITFIDEAYPDTEIKAVWVAEVNNSFELSSNVSLFSFAINYANFLRFNYANADYAITFDLFTRTVTIESSNVNSRFVLNTNTTNDKATVTILNSEGTGVPTSLPIESRTAIDTMDKITFVNSPVHLRYQNNDIELVNVYLWVWDGSLNKELNNPNITLTKNKVSELDNYISFEISEYIKAYLDKVNFAYNEATPPVTVGNGVFWQVIIDLTANGETNRITFDTKFATLGYKWNYEQTKNYNSTENNLNRWFNPKVPFYIEQSFNLYNDVLTATTSNTINTYVIYLESGLIRCSRESCLVVYLNKLGLWDIFTPHGKILIETDIESEEQNKLFRDNSRIDNSYTHSKTKLQLDVNQKYTINSGSLREDMVYQIEEIIYSPKIYLILFDGTIQDTEIQGLTIDNTFVTIDNTNITIDSATVTDEMIGLLKGFRQVPVISEDNSFIKKTRINDKNEINYTLKFKETNSKILDIK